MHLTGTAWGRSGGLGGTNPHQVVAEDELVEGSAVSNGDGGFDVFVVPVGEVEEIDEWQWEEVRCGEDASLQPFYTIGVVTPC
jgi:hypothetical protein